MGSRKQMFFAAAVIVLSMGFSVQAGWTEPIHLSELNTPGHPSDWPEISSDESIIYFRRGADDGSDYLWEAQRNEDTGLYDKQRIVYELGGSLSGRGIYGVWLSEDSHRIYSSWSDPHSGWIRLISMAERNDPDELWQQTKEHDELQQGYYCLNSVSLTSDELNIMWEAQPYGSNTLEIFMASRSSVNSDFGNIHPVTELDDLGIRDPYIAADGLTVYFHKPGDDGFFGIWKGSRSSLEEPFGDFEPLDDINRPGTHCYRPCISADGSAMYFRVGGPTMDINEKGIYVSFDLTKVAVNNIRKAIAEKEAAIAKIETAIAPEIKAIAAIDEMLESGNYEGLSRKALVISKNILMGGIHKPLEAIKEMYATIDDYNKAIAILLGE